MAFNLAAMLKRAGSRRRRIRIRPIRVRPAQVQELAAIYRSIIAIWTAGVEGIVVEYGRTVPDLTRDSPDDIERLLDMIAVETERAMVSLIARIRNWGKNTERWHRQAWAEGVFAATSVEIDTVLNEFDVTETVGAVVARNVELVRDISTQARGRIADIVFRGVTARTPTRQIAKEISEALDMSRTRARNIAIDQTVKLSSALDQARQEEAGLRHFIWRHSRKAHPRKHHQERDGRLYKWKPDGPPPGAIPPLGDMPGYAPYCLPSGEPVSFHGDILMLWRRWHSGDLTTLVTKNGRAVSCTPNHPILTRAGWKAAKLIEVGDDIVEIGNNGFHALAMNVEQAQPFIGDLFEALKRVIVPVSANGLGGEFHGDATVDEQIDTISFGDHGLRDYLKAPVPENIAKLFLEKAGVWVQQCETLRSPLKLGHGSDGSEASGMSELRLLASLLWRHFTPDQLSSLALTAHLYAALEKEVGDRFARDMQPFRDRFNALASFVGTENFRGIELLAIMSRALDGLGRKAPLRAEMLGQAMAVKADEHGNVTQKNTALQFKYSEIKYVITRAWSGHVFNLHNRENWFIAGSMAVHNCGCNAQGVLVIDGEVF